MDLNKYKYIPAICVVGYNRPDSFKRVLTAIQNSACPQGVPMIISIDRGQPGDENNEAVVRIAEEFEWTRGSKKVIWREENQNLPNHILVCADMTEEYGAIMIVEDDLYLAPYFYQYAIKATNFYADDPHIAGVAMYAISNNPYAHNLPFYPYMDGSSVYFGQFPCSWGQIWTREQWQDFRGWWSQKTGFAHEDRIPEEIKGWGDRAWDNHFFKYLWEKQKYFVHPHQGYSTNFTDAGTHFDGNDGSKFQTPLQMGQPQLEFRPFDASVSKYDGFFDIMPESLNQLQPSLAQYDYVVDLWGLKNLDLYEEGYVLTQKESKNPVLQFAGELKPFEMNVAQNLPGEDIRLVKKEDVMEKEQREPAHLYDYFYSHLPIKALGRLLKRRVQKRFSS